MRKRKFLAVLLMGVLLVGATGCSNNKQTTSLKEDRTVDLSKEVELVYYLWGGPSKDEEKVVGELNKILKEKINTTIKFRYIPWSDVSTKYPLLFASGEKFDLTHVSTSAVAPYSTLVEDDALTDLTPMLETYAPDLVNLLPKETWAGAAYNDKIFAVPCNYSEFTPEGIAYRVDLLEGSGLTSINSIDELERYFQHVVDTTDLFPINTNSASSISLYRIFLDLTSTWIKAPGISYTENFLAAKSAEEYTEIFHPAFTSEFEEWCIKMKGWSDKGYWPKDVLSAKAGSRDNFLQNTAAVYLHHLQGYIGQNGEDKEKTGSEVEFYSPAKHSGKVFKKAGIENATGISITSEHPERALMAVNLLMTDKEAYDLMHYGILGRNYDIIDGRLAKPEGYNPETDQWGTSAWALRNDQYLVPAEREHPKRPEINEEYSKGAIPDPYIGFSFDGSKVSSEIAAVSNVNAQLGIQLMLGKTQKDVKEAVQDYRNELEKAGVNEIIAEVQRQLQEFTPIGY